MIIDNSHTFPKLELPNVRVIKGWQALTREELIDIPEFWEHRDIQTSLDNFECLEMWVSLAFHLGTRHAKGEYIVLQHNDVFYHRDCMDEMIQQMKEEELPLVRIPHFWWHACKKHLDDIGLKLWKSIYLENKEDLTAFQGLMSVESRKEFDEWFGSIGRSMYSLFQIMTLESWSMGIVRPVMEVYPWAWLFFVVFILITSFAVLNLFIGIIVDAMQQQSIAEQAAFLE